jgi:hypothetical protein
MAVYCENLFIQLAAERPKALVRLIQSNVLSPAQLTFAAEHLGKAAASISVPVLLELLHHESPLVREGALYGLSKHCKNKDVQDALQKCVQTDVSQSIKDISEELLAATEEAHVSRARAEALEDPYEALSVSTGERLPIIWVRWRWQGLFREGVWHKLSENQAKTACGKSIPHHFEPDFYNTEKDPKPNESWFRTCQNKACK